MQKQLIISYGLFNVPNPNYKSPPPPQPGQWGKPISSYEPRLIEQWTYKVEEIHNSMDYEIGETLTEDMVEEIINTGLFYVIIRKFINPAPE